MNETNTVLLDGEELPFAQGQSSIQAASADGM